MIAQLTLSGRTLRADLSRGHDLSLPLVPGEGKTPNCFWAPWVEAEPVRAGDFVGRVAEGGPVNFFNLRFNPHGNGTHTECYGHLDPEQQNVNDCLEETWHLARLVTLYPRVAENGDRVVYRDQLEALWGTHGELSPTAFVLRTMPNDDLKRTARYSGGNPPYLHHEAAAFLVEKGVEHLLLDLPSLDREEDGGELLAHRAFWQYPQNIRKKCTITELIFVKNEIKDDFYLLQLQVAPFALDASPSRPLLYPLL
jgi:arylformamidase